jgi:PEP-CTERM motif
MYKHLLALAVVAGLTAPAHALSTGDIAFTAFNADEDGLSFVAFADISADTTIYFGDNEWSGSAFNTGESFSQWNSGASIVAAGTVVRLIDFDKPTSSASVGTLSRVTAAGSTNWGIASSNETVYAYLGAEALAPTTFLAAVTNGTFAANGPLTGTGLTEGVDAIRLNALVPAATPDYAEYTGPRSGQTSFAGYKPLVADVANWVVDTTNGTYTTSIPDTTAFSVTPIPEPGTYAMLLAGLGVVAFVARRRS